MLASLAPAEAHDAAQTKQQRLPHIAPAPAFALISQDGAPVALADFRDKVVAVTSSIPRARTPARCSPR